MRILFIHNGSDLYGSSRSLLRLSSRLHRDGHSVKVVLPYDGPLCDELVANGIEVTIHTDLPVITRQKFGRPASMMKLAVNLLTSTIRIIGLIKRFHPQVIHTNTVVIPSPGLAAKLTRTAHVWHLRESMLEFPRLWSGYQWYMRIFSNVLLCVSTPISKQFHPSILQAKVRVLHNGFPRNEFLPVEPGRIYAFRNQFGLIGHIIVGVVGRIKFQRKGQDVFVRAAALLKDRFPEVRFVCIGSPYPGNEEHLNNLIALIKELGLEGHVIYTGDVEDIKAAYAALDICVLPSSQPEPFGGVVIEAMAMGKPVVGTRLGGTIEQIVDGQTGFLVNPNDPSDMAHAIQQLLDKPELRACFGERGRQRYLDMFEFEIFFEKMLSVYDSLSRGAFV